MKVIVLGAGLSGLAAACHLVGDGHDVTVLERDGDVGGRAGRLVRDGFTFDSGPVVMTMPELLERPLRAAGTDPAQALTMRQLDPGYRAAYADGSQLRTYADPTRLRAEIAQVAGEREGAGFDRLHSWLQRLYETEFDAFLDTNYASPLGLLRRPREAADLLRIGGFRSLDAAIGDFFDDDRLVKLFSFQALYAGVSPKQARAVLAVIAYMDSIRGVWFPEGGMHAIPRALAAAVEHGGGTIHLGAPVTRLLRRADGAVAGVELASGDRLRADAVVCTLDLPTAYDLLLPEVRAPRALRRGDYSPSCVVWHLGVRGAPDPQVGHHNIHFGSDWHGAFEALIERRTLMPDPSRLVTIPSLSDPSMAPAGCSTLYVLEPVPHLGGDLDWADAATTAAMRERLLTFLDAHGYPTDIVTEELVTPRHWQAAGMHLGTPFALAHTFVQSGPFRPANVAPAVPGLVFAGSGTQPGVGVPMVLMSGHLAAQRIRTYAGSSR